MYRHMLVGGTFDGLHKGHVHFLHAVFSNAGEVTIGLTSEAYIRRFKKFLGVSPFSLRYKALTAWLRSNGYAARAHIIPLDNAWGPSIFPDGYDSIAVTADNRHAAIQINTVRQERGVPPLALFEITLIDAQDKKTISSTRVRSGEIDTSGRLLLPDSLRPELKKPLGRIVPNYLIKQTILTNKDQIIASVGDVTTETMFLCGVQPSLAVIDLKVERNPYRPYAEFKFPKKYRMLEVQSGPGYISAKAEKAISSWVRGIKRRVRTVIVVDGEEDLLVLPVIIQAPLGSFVYYGSPPVTRQEGLVEARVTKELKRTVRSILSSFIR